MEKRSEEDAENTTDEEEKDRYLTLKRELNRLGKAEDQMRQQPLASSIKSPPKNQKEREQEKLIVNLQGEIGSQISKIEHIDASCTQQQPLELDDLEKSRRWRLSDKSVEERSKSRHEEKGKNVIL